MRLIDADALCRSLVDWMFESFGKDDGHDVEFGLINKVVAGIDAHPTIDAVPVVHGEWAHDGPKFNGGVDWYHCSACLSPESGVYASRPYCSWCGAKMDGGADNGN